MVNQTQPDIAAPLNLKNGPPLQAGYGIALVVIVIVATWLRFSHLDRHEPWLDENCTFFLIDEFPAWGAVGERWNHEVAHLPYVFLLKGWSALVGDTMWHLRAWSALVGTATVLAIAGLAGAMAGRRAALVAAMLLAVHPLHVHYSQEARVYATWMLAITCFLYTLYRAACDGRLRWWLVYGVVALLAALVHYYTLFLLPATIFAAGVAAGKRDFLRTWFWAHLALFPFMAAIIWYLVLPLGGSGPRWWLVSEWSDRHPAQLLARSIWAMMPSGGYPNYLGPLAFVHHQAASVLGGLPAFLMRWVPAVMVFVVLVLSLWMRGRPNGSLAEKDACMGIRRGNGRATITWLILLSGGYLAGIWVYSYFVDPAYIVGRYDLAALPALVVALALAIDRFFDSVKRRSEPGRANVGAEQLLKGQAYGGTRGLGLVVMAVLGSCSVLTLYVARSVPEVNEVTLRAQRIAAEVGEKDLVIGFGGFRWFVDYVWKGAGIRAELRSFPPWHDGQLCWDNPEAELGDPARIRTAVSETLHMVRAALEANRRVFILASGGITGPRWEVDRQFIEAAHGAGMDIIPVDEWAGLGEIIVKTGRGAESSP